ncbi:MAG: hypothetical protein HLUCCA12_17910 [Rhodobacteraceae bacterium HLUCCA12]|nr:MAG: hypothetical protein HLUCCA12_17910 [Rhodobacteraceae bacterium HLUCCA12]
MRVKKNGPRRESERLGGHLAFNQISGDSHQQRAASSQDAIASWADRMVHLACDRSAANKVARDEACQRRHDCPLSTSGGYMSFAMARNLVKQPEAERQVCRSPPAFLSQPDERSRCARLPCLFRAMTTHIATRNRRSADSMLARRAGASAEVHPWFGRCQRCGRTRIPACERPSGWRGLPETALSRSVFSLCEEQ